MSLALVWSLQALTFCGHPIADQLQRPLSARLTWKKNTNTAVQAGNRMLHAMLHVQDIDQSLKFYEDLGMKVLSCNRRPNGAATAFIGFGELRDMASFALELAAPKRLDDPDGSKGVKIGSFKGLTVSQPRADPDLKILKDPDGYPVEVVPETESSIVAVCLETSDLDASIAFYTDKLGMSKAKDAKGLVPSARRCYLQYSSGPTTKLCLCQSNGAVEIGSGFDHLVISTADVEAAAEQLQEKGVKIALPPTVMFGLKITGIVDDDGYKVYLVDEADFQKGS